MSNPQQPTRVFRSSPHHPGGKPSPKSVFASPGMSIVAAFGSFFVAYLFNIRGLATALDSYLGNMNRAAQSHQEAVASIFLHALPAIVGAMVLFLMLIFLRTGGDGNGQSSKSSGNLDAFVQAAAGQGISPKVARSAYRVLLPFVRKNKFLGIDDSLFHDLKLAEDELSDVYGSLLRLSDRRRRTGDDGTGIRGVMGLLMAVESSEDAVGSAMTPATDRVLVMAAAAPGPLAGEDAKPRKPSAVLAHPTPLRRRELSMIRPRPLRGA